MERNISKKKSGTKIQLMTLLTSEDAFTVSKFARFGPEESLLPRRMILFRGFDTATSGPEREVSRKERLW